MSVRINLEIGHEASIRNKKTHDGFTHDWEVFVRGCDNAEIHHYVEKVVFHLHETFPKPKRVVREPPYVVKESGYAGFNFPIEIYLKNNGEPKKIKFNYDLHLQPAGPAIIKVQKEKYVFNSVSEEFKQKLVKGGGIIVSSHENVDRTSNIEEKKELLNKPKLSGSMIKKHKTKPDEPYSFQYFGTPITKSSKVTTENKPLQKDNKISANKDKEKLKIKESPNKDKEKERDKTKYTDKDKKRDEKKKDKERSKERERSKEKSSKRDKSPPVRPRSPSPKKASPKRQQSPTLPQIKHRDKEEKKLEKEKEQRKSEEKFEKKPKKDKREHKDNNKYKEKEFKTEHLKSTKEILTKSASISIAAAASSSPKIEKKEKTSKDTSDIKDIDTTDKDNISTIKEKIKSEDKPKHKHKKKDKDRKEKKEEKKEKKAEKNNLFDSPPKYDQKPLTKPLNTLISSIVDDSSNNSLSSNDNQFNEIEIKKEPPPPPPPPIEVKKLKSEAKKEKKRSKEKKDEDKKRKRKAEQVLEEEPPDKIKAENNSEDESVDHHQPVKEEVDNKENKENPEDYMNILRDLQHKIMALQDNTELQKVVQLIAETGRYEVSARTFDFDLCLLERSTVKQLQEFFASSS